MKSNKIKFMKLLNIIKKIIKIIYIYILFEISIMYEIGHRPKSCEIVITLLYFISFNIEFV